MKKLSVTLLALLILSVGVAAWYSSNTTLQSGNYQNVGWGQTLTIAANSDVRFTGSTNFSGGHLIIRQNATLTIQSQGLSANGTITLEQGASLIVNGNLSLNNAAAIMRINGGTVTVSGNLSQSGPLEVGSDGLLEVNGTLTSSSGGITVQDAGRIAASNLIFNGNHSIAGFLEASQLTRINGGNLAFSGCGELRTRTLQVQNGNTVSGNGFVQVAQTYTNGRNSGWSGHPLTNSNGIGVYYTGPASNASWGNAYMSPTSTNPCLDLLPVSFEKFKAFPQINNSFMLEWTAPETEETESYEIEVSEDNINFRTIEIVPAKGIKGDLRYQQKVNLGF
jgi:hypothetical protein